MESKFAFNWWSELGIWGSDVQSQPGEYAIVESKLSIRTAVGALSLRLSFSDTHLTNVMYYPLGS